MLASELPWREKVEATFHLTANLAYPLMVLLSALMFPAMLLRYNMGWAEMIVVDVPIFLAATASVCTFYALSQKEQFASGWKRKLRYIPAVLGIGVGISINNALAVIEGLLRQVLRVRPHAEVRDRGGERHLEAEGLQGQVQLGALRRARARRLLHVHLDLRARPRARGHAALHRALPVGLPLHLRDVAGAAIRVARAAPAGGLRTSSPASFRAPDANELQGAGVRRVLLITLGLNLAVSAGKVVVGQLSGSLAMVADGYHSLVDSANNVIGLIVAAFAFRPPDQGHPYGHRKFETAATAVIGIALLSLAWELVTSALGRGGRERPPEISFLNWAVMAVTIGVNLFVSWYEAREGKRLKSAFLVADSAHTRSDLYVSLGVVASFILARAGLGWADPLTAVLIAAIIAWQAGVILLSAFDVLTDRAVLQAQEIERLALGHRRGLERARGPHARPPRRDLRRPHRAPRRGDQPARRPRRGGRDRASAREGPPRHRGRRGAPRAGRGSCSGRALSRKRPGGLLSRPPGPPA